MAVDGFDYKQFEKYVNKLEIATDDFQLFLKKFLLEQAQRVVANAKKRSPVDTGAYRASWSIGNQKVRLKKTGGTSKSGGQSVTIDVEHSDIASVAVVGNYLQVEIYNPMEYASFIEYGHGKYPAQYVLTISIDIVEKAMTGRFNNAFKEFLKERGVV